MKKHSFLARLVLASLLASSPVLSALPATIPVTVSHVEWRETFQPTLNFELRRVPPASAAEAVFGANALSDRLSPAVATWSLTALGGLPYAGSLPTDTLQDGEYILACWTGPAEFSPGEPYGCTRFTTITNQIPRVSIEIFEVNGSMPRINLATLKSDREAWDSAAIEVPTNTPPSLANSAATIRRIAVNGSAQSGEVLLRRSLANGTILTEADLIASLADGVGDLDWDGPLSSATNATYSIEFAGLTASFLNRFEAGSAQTAVTGLAVVNGVAKWKHPNAIAKAYPACQVRVWSNAACTSLVWDSGVIAAPPRESDGLYCLILPETACPAIGTTYYIGVSMLDAKFTSPDNNETRVSFTPTPIPGGVWLGGRISNISIPVAVSAVDWRAAPAPRSLRFEARKIASTNLLGFATTDYRAAPFLFGEASASWTVPITRGLPYVGTLPPVAAALPAGDYILSCWEGSGDYTPAVRYGCSRFTISGWLVSPARVSIELSEINPLFPRIDLATGATDRQFWNFSDCIATLEFKAPAPAIVHIDRTAINDLTGDYYERIFREEDVVDAFRVLPGQGTITEADILAALPPSEGDIDWGGAVATFKANGMLWPTITNVVYRASIGGLAVDFNRRLGKGSTQSAVTNLTVSAGVATWRQPLPVAQTYPACQVRVWSNAACTTLVWDSGVIRAPARDANGYYHYALPPEAVPPSGSTWYVGVSMLDAKFASPGDNETHAAFTP